MNNYDYANQPDRAEMVDQNGIYYSHQWDENDEAQRQIDRADAYLDLEDMKGDR